MLLTLNSINHDCIFYMLSFLSKEQLIFFAETSKTFYLLLKQHYKRFKQPSISTIFRSIETLNWAINHNFQFNIYKSSFNKVIKYGNLELIDDVYNDYIYNNNSRLNKYLSPKLYSIAFKRNDITNSDKISIFKWLKQKKIKYSWDIYNDINEGRFSSNPNIQQLSLYLDNTFFFVYCDLHLFNIIKDDDVVTLNWVITSIPDLSNDVFNQCAQFNSWSCAKYALKNRLPWDETTCAYASESGNLQMLKWLRKHNCPWNYFTSHQAGISGFFETFVWSIENNCDYNKDILIPLLKAENEIDCLNWFLNYLENK